jgi:hypothetical protein
MGREVLVGRALIPPAAVAPDEPVDGEVELAGLPQEIGVRRQLRQGRALPHRHVGVDEQQVVRRSPSQLHQLAAVAAEVHPRPFVQRAR